MKIDKASMIRLEADKLELVTLLNKYGLSTFGVTPYGLLDRVNKHLSNDERLVILYNSYYTNSLLHNGNKWLDIAWLLDCIPFDTNCIPQQI